MNLQKLLALILGEHQSSTITGVLVALALNYVGSDSLSPKDMLLFGAVIIFVARFLGEGVFARGVNSTEPPALQPPPRPGWPQDYDRHQSQIVAIPPALPSDEFRSAVRGVGKRTLAPLLLCFLLLSQAACGGAELDQVLLWSDRVVGYTDTARSLVLDFYCEDCTEHGITKEQSLIALRTLQGLHNANGEIYRLLRANMNAEQTAVTLDGKARAKIDAQVPLLQDKVNYYGKTLPPESVKRLQPTTKLLTSAVNQFVGSIARAPVNDKGVVTITLTPQQRAQFNQQYARVTRVAENLEAVIQ